MNDDDISQGTEAASQVASTASEAQSLVGAVEQGGPGGAMTGVSSAASLASAATPLASAHGPAAASAGAATQTVGRVASAASQVGGVARSMSATSPAAGPSAASSTPSPASGGSPAPSSFGGSDAEALANAMSALVAGPAGDGVSLRFEAEPSVTTPWTASLVTVHETLSARYEAHVRLVTHDVTADASELLGASVSLAWSRGRKERKLHGIVDEVTTGDGSSLDSETTTVTVRVVPAVALLALTKKTRIFQGQTVPEILEAVLGDALAPYHREVELDTDREYPKCEYRTQYDESDLAFVDRLCAEEGLISLFEQSGSEEKLRIVDDASKYPALDGGPVPYSVLEGTAGHAVIGAFHRSDRLRPTKLSLRHFDFAKPGTFVEGTEPSGASSGGSSSGSSSGDAPPGATRGPDREVYEHDTRPITFSDYDEGRRAFGADDSAAQRKLRRAHATQEAVLFAGHGTVTGLSAGSVFTLTGHPQDLDGEYVVVSIAHSIGVGDAAQSHGESARLAATYTNHFTCVPSNVAYRPTPCADKPRVRGVLTATVVGPEGEEIHTDSYGRVKVQFHWDREGANDAHSSCFVRVVQPWAGQGWGFVFLPRIGMEAVVTFVDGDPDRPIVTGTVYNGSTPLPETLPDTKTKSILRTNTSPGGNGFNELSFEDAKDEEKVFLHAQKDLSEVVKNAHSTSVGGAQSISVSGDRSVSVKKAETYTVEGNRTTEVKGGEDKLTITSKWTVDATSEIAITAPDKITLTCGGSTITMEPGKIAIVSGGNSWLVLDDKADLTASGHAQVYLTDAAYMKSAQSSHVHLTAAADLRSSQSGQVYLTGDALMQSAGGATVKLTANAAMSGAEASVSGLTKGTLSATGGSVETAPAGVTVAGPKIDVSGGMVNIAGAMVKVN